MASTAPQYYRLHDVRICVRGNRPALLRALDATLRYKGAEAAEAPPCPDLVLDFSATASPPAAIPNAVTLIGQSERSGVAVWRDTDRMYLSRGDAVVTLDPATGRATATLPPALAAFSERRREPLFYLITLSLAVLLRFQRWFPLHTAALTRQGNGLLLVAESDSGKSTTALNLVRQGWDYLSDDTVLLRADAKGARAYAFRRPFCVDPEATALFPELAEQPWPASLSDATKWQVEAERLYPGRFVATCTPRAVVLPEIVSADTSALVPASAKEVLGHLTNQSGFFMTPDPEIASEHLDVFRRLITQSSLHHLKAGRDLLDDPTKADRLLTPLLEDASAA